MGGLDEKFDAEVKRRMKVDRAQYEADRVVDMKHLADCLVDANASWKQAFWEEETEVKSGYFIEAQYSIKPLPEAIALLAFGLYESRNPD